MSFWTRVRLPPAPLIFIRRDPPKVGGILMKHADACERSSPFNASAPLNFIRKDPPKVGGILMKHADACERSSPFNASAPLNFIRKDPPKVGGILMKHADACERSSPFNASAPLWRQCTKYYISCIFCLIYELLYVILNEL